MTDRALHRVADALRLTSLERTHLLALARAQDADAADLDLPPVLVDYVRTISDGIAFLTAPEGTVVAWNGAADRVFAFSSLAVESRNLVVGLVRGSAFRDALPDWRDVLDNMIAVMHANYLVSSSPSFEALVRRLTGEPLFDAAWRARRIESIPLHVCTVRDPHAGPVRMRLFAFTPTHSPHHTLIALNAATGDEK